jgi:hypothetical protein
MFLAWKEPMTAAMMRFPAVGLLMIPAIACSRQVVAASGITLPAKDRNAAASSVRFSSITSAAIPGAICTEGVASTAVPIGELYPPKSSATGCTHLRERDFIQNGSNSF